MTIEVPEPDEISREWWDATREHRLLVQWCGACQHVQHPPRAVCTRCGSTEQLSGRDSSGAGSVDSWTEVHRAPRPGIEVPYVIARVRLNDGPILLSRLLGETPWEIGEPLAVGWLDLDDGRALPVFRRPAAQTSDN